jgi:uncharacterized membrane protein
MKARKFCLHVLAAAAAITSMSHCEAEAQTYMFRVCNNSQLTAAVAVESLTAPGSSTFQVRGWWTVGPSQCSNIDNLPLGWVYFYAEEWGSNGKTIVWQGVTLRDCVQYPGPFDTLNLGADVCDPSQLKNFQGEYLGSPISTYTWTLN